MERQKPLYLAFLFQKKYRVYTQEFTTLGCLEKKVHNRVEEIFQGRPSAIALFHSKDSGWSLALACTKLAAKRHDVICAKALNGI